MKFGTATINETQHQFIKFYKEEVEKASGGRIEVQVYPASQLGPIPREIEGVQLGNIQGFIGPVDFFVGVDPRFGVFSAPLLFKDDANAEATIHDPGGRKRRCSISPRPSAWSASPLWRSAHPTTAPRSRSCTLADFNGKKLRINGTELERQKMAKLGATGVGMPLSEVMPALDQGTIDGTISGMSVFVALKMNDLIKMITVTNDTYLIAIAWCRSRGSIRCRRTCRRSCSTPACACRRGRRTGRSTSPRSWMQTGQALGGEIHKIAADQVGAMKDLLGPVADEATKDQPAVHDMLQMVRAVAAKN